MGDDLLTSLFAAGGFGELIENVEITLALHLSNDSVLLEEVVGNLCTNGFPVRVEHDFKIFSLAAGSDTRQNIT